MEQMCLRVEKSERIGRQINTLSTVPHFIICVENRYIMHKTITHHQIN